LFTAILQSPRLTMADFHFKKLASVFLRLQENLNLSGAKTLQILSSIYA
jgi:hypothetical protein